MSKSKKKRKNNRVSAEEKAALRQERAELRAKQNRRALYAIGGFIICAVVLVALLVATLRFHPEARYTAEQYQQLQTGMSYEQVVDVLGHEGEAAEGGSGTDDSQTYIWSNDDGSSITVTFTGDTASAIDQEGISNDSST